MDAEGHSTDIHDANVLDEKEEKARLKRIAAEKRKKAMDQMQRLQKNFAKVRYKHFEVLLITINISKFPNYYCRI